MGWRDDYQKVPGKLRKLILERDGFRCRIAGPGCQGKATQVDHVVPDFEGGTAVPANLAAVCYHCHKLKSQQESQRAKKRIREAAKNPPWKHPGILE